MKTSKQGIKFIQQFESCRLTTYQVGSDKPTIGHGNTFYASGRVVKLGDTITQKQADELFAFTMEGFEDIINRVVKQLINQNQFDALVSFVYNVGPGRPGVEHRGGRDGFVYLKNGRPSTLLKLINANPADPAIAPEFLKWISGGSIFEKGLLTRRKAEAELYFKPITDSVNGLEKKPF
jgi:lysozyme